MAFANPRDLVPHSGQMLLLHSVVTHDAEQTVCEVRVADSTLFRNEGGDVPAWVGIEYMAQCIAAHGGLVARTSGKPPQPGMLLGTRRLEINVPTFASNQVLHVSARSVHVGAEMVSFACEIRDATAGGVLAVGRLNVYVGKEIAGDSES